MKHYIKLLLENDAVYRWRVSKAHIIISVNEKLFVEL